LLERVERHPRLVGLDREREAAEVEVQLAGERYKPAFGVDLSYGFRQGRMADGGSVPDMLTAMLTFDVPLFTRNRQDRDASAARARVRAADSRRADQLRAMQATLRAEHARALRLASLIELYETRVAGLAEMSVDAALAGYRASDESLDSVVDSERRLLEIRDRLAKARQEYALSLAEVAYLAGEPS
jgi:outer membrane protein TolC